MAHMVPDVPAGNAAERRVFAFLKHALAPQHDAWVFQELQTSNGPADFVVVAPDLGVLVLEVKAWSDDAIIDPGATRWRVRKGRAENNESNPLEQARQYSYAIRADLERVTALLGATDRGKLQVPVSAMAALPNLTRGDYSARNIESVLPRQWVLLKEDLAPAATPEGLKRLFGALRDWQKSRKLERRIFQIALDRLRPSIRPARSAPTIADFREELLFLEEGQRQVADDLGPGRHIVEGPQGSGKTIVLVQRACRVARENPKARILLLCFNLTLASHLRRLVHRQNVGTTAQPGHVNVVQFFDFVGKLVGTDVDHSSREPAYFDDLLMQATSAPAAAYDLVLVDEAQDFSTEMLLVATRAAAPGAEFVLALDESQSLYARDRDLAAAGLDRVRRHPLGPNYRNAQRIQRFLVALLGGRASVPAGAGNSALEGETPRAVELTGSTTLAEFLAADIESRVQDGRQGLGDIAIVYNDKTYKGGDFRDGPRGFVKDVVEALDARAISSFWVSDVRSKQLFDAGLDRVTIASIHSAKGLDLGIVYLVGVDNWESSTEGRDRLDTLLRVGLGRACFGLVIPYRRRAGLIERMVATGAIDDMTIEETPASGR